MYMRGGYRANHATEKRNVEQALNLTALFLNEATVRIHLFLDVLNSFLNTEQSMTSPENCGWYFIFLPCCALKACNKTTFIVRPGTDAFLTPEHIFWIWIWSSSLFGSLLVLKSRSQASIDQPLRTRRILVSNKYEYECTV